MSNSKCVELKATNTGIQFFVKVVPGSNRTASAGTLNGMLKIKVAAPPEKGKANQCLMDYLSRFLGVKKNQITIVSGAASPVKKLQIKGISAEHLQQCLDTLSG